MACGTALLSCPANGRVKPDFVFINGQPERHTEGSYYLEWRENGRRVRLSVGKDAADATARRQRKEAELNALNKDVAVVPDNGENGQISTLPMQPFASATNPTEGGHQRHTRNARYRSPRR
jgi:hypothetical protein